MKLNITFGEPPEPTEPTVILTEARAKIIWGEDASSVCHFLTSNGLSEAEAEAKIKEFVAERNAEIRRIGIRNTVIGAVLAGGAGILLYLFYIHFKQSNSVPNYRAARGVAVVGLGGLFGIWLLVKGIFYLVRPQSEVKSITDIL